VPDVYPLHDRDAVVSLRTHLHRKKINIWTVMAGQRLGLKEVDDGNWVVTFMAHDLGYIDLEQKTLQPIDNPFGTRMSPCLRYGPLLMSPGWTQSKAWLRG
jgi:hypothetical protein